MTCLLVLIQVHTLNIEYFNTRLLKKGCRKALEQGQVWKLRKEETVAYSTVKFTQLWLEEMKYLVQERNFGEQHQYAQRDAQTNNSRGLVIFNQRLEKNGNSGITDEKTAHQKLTAKRAEGANGDDQKGPSPPLLKVLGKAYGKKFLGTQLSMFIYAFAIYVNPMIMWYDIFQSSFSVISCR